MIYPITLYKSHPPLLEAYAILARHRAMGERGRYSALLDQANKVLWEQYSHWPELEQKIVATMGRIRARTEGTPMTETEETLDPTDDQPGMTQQAKAARRFMLKKAWRQVRTLCHPDKGPGYLEEFQILNEAYRAGDLLTLTEYVIAINRTILEQIEHWLNEAKKPAINWQILQQMPMFRIVRLVHQGQMERAREVAFQQRSQRLRELELEELTMG